MGHQVNDLQNTDSDTREGPGPAQSYFVNGPGVRPANRELGRLPQFHSLSCSSDEASSPEAHLLCKTSNKKRRKRPLHQSVSQPQETSEEVEGVFSHRPFCQVEASNPISDSLHRRIRRGLGVSYFKEPPGIRSVGSSLEETSYQHPGTDSRLVDSEEDRVAREFDHPPLLGQ